MTLLLLLEDLVAKLQSFDVVCEVVEIDCCSLFLQEVNALYSDLSELLIYFTYFRRLPCELEDAVSLLWFVFLGQYDRVQALRLYPRLLKVLIYYRGRLIRDLDRQ